MEIKYRLQGIGGLKFGSVTKRAVMICINDCFKVEAIMLEVIKVGSKTLSSLVDEYLV
jgi:hypothetical protein